MTTRSVKKNTPLYFYDPYSLTFIGVGTSGDSDNYIMPDNCTITAPPEAMPNKCIMYDVNADDWYYIPDRCYQVDKDGFYQQTLSNPLISDAYHRYKDQLIDIPPDNTLIRPRWNGETWEDKPIPTDMFAPRFNHDTKEWEESLTDVEYNAKIDQETDELIQAWCKDQTKNEAYYINRGVEHGKDDPEYQTYLTAKTDIINQQKARKKI